VDEIAERLVQLARKSRVTVLVAEQNAAIGLTSLIAVMSCNRGDCA
jgi:ABC-type branched-subunit amino acid transport system ATPase component